jgi:predicted alpha/beta superfamily hydrolase
MSNWQRYSDLHEQHTVVGDLRVLPQVESPQLGNHRDVLIWLPPTYAAGDRRYPVIYMHDGQNLFDAQSGYSGEWQVDETLTALAAEGLEAIVVGLPNAGQARSLEYNPYHFAEMPDLMGRGADYIRFLVETIKPLIDADFRTLPDAAHTTIAGSSMGGLISLYGFLLYPQVFGLCGAFSTAYWFGGCSLLPDVQARAEGRGKVYLDVGTREGDIFAGRWIDWKVRSDDPHESYVEGVQDLRDALLARGYRPGENLLYVEEADAPHHESAWARRLPNALRFLLKEI